MTLGFAAAAWIPPDPPAIMVAADTRIWGGAATLTDAGIKTYDLGGRTGMVAAGHALAALTAAQGVRPIVDNHNRWEPDRPLGFLDTTRLLAFFLKRAAEQQGAVCQVAVAGFLTSGVPALAAVTVSATRNRVRFFDIKERGTLALPVGESEARHLLLCGFDSAKREGKPVLATGLCLLWYISQHPGAFSTVGGGLSVGVCAGTDTSVSWPVVEIAGRRFLRGVEVTDYYRPNWPAPEVLPYDEGWCAALDERVTTGESLAEFHNEYVTGYDIDLMSTPETLFQTHDDPEGFDNGVPRPVSRQESNPPQ
jgi:hypothetical protein